MSPVAALVLALVAAGFVAQWVLASHLQRIPDAFAGLADRPAKPAEGHASRAMNILLMGTQVGPAAGSSDTEAPAWAPEADRTESISILHIGGDRRGAALISLPRSALVDSRGGAARDETLGAALTSHHPAGAVQRVEELTGVRIDHLMVVDWRGFRQLG